MPYSLSQRTEVFDARVQNLCLSWHGTAILVLLSVAVAHSAGSLAISEFLLPASK